MLFSCDPFDLFLPTSLYVLLLLALHPASFSSPLLSSPLLRRPLSSLTQLNSHNLTYTNQPIQLHLHNSTHTRALGAAFAWQAQYSLTGTLTHAIHGHAHPHSAFPSLTHTAELAQPSLQNLHSHTATDTTKPTPLNSHNPARKIQLT